MTNKETIQLIDDKNRQIKLLRQAVMVAVITLADNYREDVLNVFTEDELDIMLNETEEYNNNTTRVENVYKQALDNTK